MVVWIHNRLQSGGGAVTKPASTLPVGSSVYAKESGTKTEFIVVHQGNPDTSKYSATCDGTWIMRKDVYPTGIIWGPNSNDYGTSNVNMWLNSTYLNTLNISSVIKDVKIPYYTSRKSETSIAHILEDGLSCKAFLLGLHEAGLYQSEISAQPDDGAKLDYFEDGLGDSARQIRIAYKSGSASDWYLRSPLNRITTHVFFVVDGGGGGNSQVVSATPYEAPQRPCFIIPSDTEVDEFGNIVV